MLWQKQQDKMVLKLVEKCPVKKILTKNNKIVGVETNMGK